MDEARSRPAVGVPRARDLGRTSPPPLWDLVRARHDPSRRRQGGNGIRAGEAPFRAGRTGEVARGARRVQADAERESLMLPWSYAQAVRVRGGKMPPEEALKVFTGLAEHGGRTSWRPDGGRWRAPARQTLSGRLEGALEFYARAASAPAQALTESQALIRKGDLASETLAYCRRRRRRRPGRSSSNGSRNSRRRRPKATPAT